MHTPENIQIDSTRAIHPYVFSPRPSISEALHILTEMMEAKDSDLLEHGRRTAQYATRLGGAIGIPARDLIDLYYASVLHDIGKVMLPDGLFQKSGPLSHEEYVSMQCHPREGARLLTAIPSLRRAAVLIAHHHEHWDGSGYPYGLRGAFIPLGSRILAVADRFDALSSDKTRVVGGRSAPMKLLRMLRGSQLDPTLVGRFLHQIEEESRTETCSASLV
jgi:HD-GYP domain-containing protein (c-di-GMP phosphodiesterase class II)